MLLFRYCSKIVIAFGQPRPYRKLRIKHLRIK